jgi:shikimate dehydrogenase
MTDASRHAFVIGWPIKHSRSPLIHNYWLRTLGLKGSYERVAVPPEELETFFTTLNGRFVGGNVTLPHKEHAYRACARRTATAQRLGAVNTLWFENGDLCGDNTDVAGFVAALDEASSSWHERVHTAVVLGAGGAARAIVEGLRQRGVKRTFLVNRTPQRAHDLARHFTNEILVSDWHRIEETLRDADLLVNTTSLGMIGQPALTIDIGTLPSHALVCDIVYVPLETPLLRAARAQGHITIGGLGMLLHQAVPGFEKWFGRRPQVTPELRALVEADVRNDIPAGQS